MRTIKFKAWNPESEIMMETRTIQELVQTNISKYFAEKLIFLQYSDKEDKNNKPVCDGDICKVTYYNHATNPTTLIQQVCIENSTFVLKHKSGTNTELEDSRLYVPLYYSNSPNTIEVIGNIYENPELLY